MVAVVALAGAIQQSSLREMRVALQTEEKDVPLLLPARKMAPQEK